MRAAVKLALVFGLMCLVTTGFAQDGSGSDDDDDDGAADGNDGDSMNVTDTGSGNCPKDCSNHGKCVKNEDDEFSCDCDAGYLGDDCAKLADQFDVYYQRVMAMSKSSGLAGKLKLAEGKLTQWDARIANMQGRFQSNSDDVHRFVDALTITEMHRLDLKQKVIDEAKTRVDALEQTLCNGPCSADQSAYDVAGGYRKNEGLKIDEMVADWTTKLNEKIVKLKEREDRNAVALKKLADTINKGNEAGEMHRFDRIVENWELCEINPTAKGCKDKKKPGPPPGIHIVVETKNSAKFYPTSLAADEKQAAKSLMGGVKTVVKARQK